MKQKLSILYSWFIKTLTCLLPNAPVFMRLRGFLYSIMMEKCGEDFQVTSSAILLPLSGLVVGNHVYIAHNTVVMGPDVEIGDEVIIGPNCVISSANHSFRGSSYRFGPSEGRKITLDKGSWVAANCSVLAGSFLPERSVLAAGAVLTKAFSEKDCLYAGVPAKRVKKIRDESEYERP